MGHWNFRVAGDSAALNFARKYLEEAGWVYDNSARYLLLPVPTKEDHRAFLRCDTVVIGGNLDPALYKDRKCVDLLKDPIYLAENARITAYCAVKYALRQLPVILDGCPVLILGWGRIGKCLGQLLGKMGADVTVYARKECDRAAIISLGYGAIGALEDLKTYRVIFNTVPVLLFPEGSLTEDQVKIDLASQPGIAGDDVVIARGLPGRDAPESSGILIARTIERLQKEGLL